MTFRKLFSITTVAVAVFSCNAASHAQRPVHLPSTGSDDFTQFTSGNSGVSSLEALQEQINNQSADITDLSSALKKKAGPGVSSATMKIVGRVHADYWGFPDTSPGIDAIEGGDPQDRLAFRRARFGVRGKLPANMEYRIEMEFAGGNATQFRDVWIGWNDIPFFQTVLLGNQKRPYGLAYLNSSRFNVFLERPFAIEAINQNVRRLGLQSYGVSKDQNWNWRYGVFNQRQIADEGNYTNDHLQLEFASRLANTFWYDEVSGGRGYGHWGISGTTAYPDGSTAADNGAVGPDQNEARFRCRPESRSASHWLDTGLIDGADNYQMLGLESALNVGPLHLAGEYQNVWLERDAGAGNDLHFSGGYVEASYFLTGEHTPWNRRSGTIGRVKPFENFFVVRTSDGQCEKGLGAWQVAARYSYSDFNDMDILGGIGESVTFGLNWYWTPNARMQFNWINGTIDNNSGNSGNYDIVGTRFMVDF